MHVKNHVLFALLAGAVTGCSSQSQAPTPTQLRQQPREFSFRLSGALAEAGITFGPARQLEVGPASNGQVHRGKLSSSEHSGLTQAWEKYRETAFTGAQGCQDWAQDSMWRETTASVEILENGKNVLTLRTEGGKLCGTGDPAALREVAETLFALTRRRYPQPFPSECLALQDDFVATAESATACSDDSQCTNVDPQFEAIPEGQIQYVSLKQASAVPAFPSANRGELASVRRKLLKLKGSIAQACQAVPAAAPAAAETLGFQNHRHPARCIESRCTTDVAFQID